MREKILKTLIIIIVIFNIGCGTGVYEIISRDQGDPDEFAIEVDSFSEENKIKCKWSEDERSDKYILMRSEDKPLLKFKEVYNGKAKEYEDRVLKEDTRYIYRLDKLRGKKRFYGKVHYMGIYSKDVNDVYEPNDKKGEAELLQSDKQGNVYYYRSHEGSILEDEDWYKVRIPGKRQAKVTIIYDAVNLPFIITKPYNGDKERPATNAVIILRNDMDYEQELSFKISLDRNIVVSGSAGGAFYPYTVRLLSIE